MGILLLDKNADFSANSLGHVGLYTSVTTDLTGLFELRQSAGKARQNSAPDNDNELVVSGTPTFNATSIDLTDVGQLTFPMGPANGGENSFAAIIKIRNGGSSSDATLGTVPPAPTTNGACYFRHWNRRMQFETTIHNAQTGTPTFVEVSTAYHDAPSDGSLDGTFQLFVATLESETALKIYWPARNALKTTSLSAGKFAYFNSAATNWKCRGKAGTTDQQSVAMFAHWERVLTADEVATFYGEMKKQFGLIGLVI